MSSLPLWASGLIGTIIFFVLMFLRMHVGFALMIGGFIGYLLTSGADAALGNLATTIFDTTHSHVLVIIPLFIVMGTLASAGGVISSAFDTFHKWFGHLRGGLSMTAVGSCAAFGAVCGDNIATALTMDKAALPEMRKYGYKDSLSFGSVAAGGNLGLLIPPSAALVVFGFITGTNIADLFIAGIIPGIILTAMFMIQIWLQVKINPSLCQLAPRASWKERLISLWGVIGIAVAFLLVMLGLIFAWFTPWEAGPIGTLAVVAVSLVYLVIGKFVKLGYPRLTFKSLFSAFMSATKTAAMILVLICGARYFSNMLSASNVASDISSWVIDSGLSRYAVMLLVAAVLLVLGCLMDIWSVMIITMPIFFFALTDPTIAQLAERGVGSVAELTALAEAGELVVGFGFEPYQVGVIVVLCVMTGCITPPVGVVVFSLAGQHREVPMYTIFRGVLPFVVTMLVLLLMLVFIPELSTWLPSFVQQ